MHLKGWRWIHGVMSGAGDEVPDHADIRVQRFGGAASCSAEGWSLSCGLACHDRGWWNGGWRSLRFTGNRWRGLSRCPCRGWLLTLQLPDLPFHGNDSVLQVAYFLQQGGVVGLTRRRRRSLLSKNRYSPQNGLKY